MSNKVKSGKCELCEREKTLTWHHLIPRKNHTKKRFLREFSKEEMRTRGANVCQDCHSTIHKFFDEKTLGLIFNTIDKLLSNDKIHNYLVWIKKQK